VFKQTLVLSITLAAMLLSVSCSKAPSGKMTVLPRPSATSTNPGSWNLKAFAPDFPGINNGQDAAQAINIYLLSYLADSDRAKLIAADLISQIYFVSTNDAPGNNWGVTQYVHGTVVSQSKLLAPILKDSSDMSGETVYYLTFTVSREGNAITPTNRNARSLVAELKK
jgi:hypothetical protein